MKPKVKSRNQGAYREMTVALIRDHAASGGVEVAFSESARFYRLSQQNPKFEDILGHLREAKSKHRAVHVLFDPAHDDAIEDAE